MPKPRLRPLPALPKTTSNYATPALEKGLDVLELLALEPRGMTKSQIARELKRTVSEIFRTPVCLERRGYITPVAEERYSLTLKLFKLVQQHPPIERLLADARPVMDRLAHETLQSCHLGVLERGRVVILAQVNAPANLGFYVKLGSTVDMMESTAGYVILAYLDPGQRDLTIAAWVSETAQKPPKDLSAHLARIRAAGYEERASYLVEGVTNISFPVSDGRGTVCALTIPHIQYSSPLKEWADIVNFLRNAAAELTSSIGGRGVR